MRLPMEKLTIGQEILFSFDNYSPIYFKTKGPELNLESYYEFLSLILLKIVKVGEQMNYVFEGNATISINFIETKKKFAMGIRHPSMEYSLYDHKTGPVEYLKDENGNQYCPDAFFSEFLKVEKKYNSNIVL